MGKSTTCDCIYSNLIVGQYYSLPNASATAAAILANTLYAMPLWIPVKSTWDTIALKITAGSAGAARLGIYLDNGLSVPSTLLVDFGTVVTTNVATVTIGSLARQLERDHYWLALISDATPTVTKGTTPLSSAHLGAPVADIGTQNRGYTANLAYGALPATFPAATLTTTAPPLLALRLASIP